MLKRMILGISLLLGSVAPVTTIVLFPNTQAAAEVYTCGSPSGHFFDGAYTSSTTVIGTSAKLINRLGLVCDTTTTTNVRTSINSSAAWVMLAGNSTSQYAQTGFIRTYNGPDYFFAQDNNNGVVDTKYSTAPLSSYGQTHHYWVQWRTTCTCLRENVDATIFQETPFNPKITWSEPFSNQWMGETHYLASDMPGNPTEGYTTYTLMQVQDVASGNFSNTLPTIQYANTNIFRYNHDVVVNHPTYGNALDIWTYYEY